MKARVAQEVVLLYRLAEDTELGRSAIKAFPRVGIPCWHVAQGQLDETASAFASASPEGRSYDGEVPEHSAMMFSDFTSSRLNQVPNRLYSAGPRNQAMKAVVIEINRTWASGELLYEPTREREAIRRQLQEQQDKAEAGQEQSE